MAREGELKWEDHLAQVLLAKPADIVHQTCEVLENHGCPVKKELKSELSSSSTLPKMCFEYCIMPTNCLCTHTHMY